MMDLPAGIKELIGDEEYHIDEIGLSDSQVIIFQDKILKIQEIGEESDNEYNMMQWLQGRIKVPKILRFEEQDGKNYLLMTKVPGEMLCEDRYLQNSEELAGILADGLLQLWKVDVSKCPYCNNLDNKLKMVKYNVDNNLVDLDNVEADTFGENGFQNPENLLEGLIQNRPEEELVLSHGDYCLPNVFVNDGEISGFIDLGRAGVADKWQDIALGYRSLQHNLSGRFGGKVYDDVDAEILFEKLGVEPDWDKIRYYILLDELF